MKILIHLLLGLALASSSFAQNYAREGLEIGLGASLAREAFDSDAGDYDDSAAFDGVIGYRFHPRLALDLHVAELSGFDLDDDLAPGSDLEVEASELTANARFFLLTGEVQPYVSIGAGWGWVDVDVDGPLESLSEDFDDPVARFGLGLDGYLSPNVALGLEAAYHMGLGDLDDFDYWTATGMLRFRF